MHVATKIHFEIQLHRKRGEQERERGERDMRDVVERVTVSQIHVKYCRYMYMEFYIHFEIQIYTERGE